MAKSCIRVCLAALFSALGLLQPAQAQGNSVTVEDVKAGSLSGVVLCCETIGLDDKVMHPAIMLQDVAISECDSSYRQCSTPVQSDAGGHFTFVSNRKGKVHHLKFVLKDYDEEHLKVTLREGSDPLRVSLVPGT